MRRPSQHTRLFAFYARCIEVRHQNQQIIRDRIVPPKVTGFTPLRYQQALRLERAEHQLGQGATMESAAKDAGFEDARMLRRLRNRPA